NQDGPGENFSSNFGVEGPTDDPVVIAAREKQKRNLLATLLLSQGVPMLLGGDELGRTQQGNNNPFNQDNPVSWYDWDLDDRRRALLRFASRLVALRKRHPALRRQAYYEVRPCWLRPEGAGMTAPDWDDPERRSLALQLSDAGDEDEELLLLLNASRDASRFVLPPGRWVVEVDTARPDIGEGGEIAQAYELPPQSLALLCFRRLNRLQT